LRFERFSKRLVFAGGVYIQGHKSQQLGIVHFRQQPLATFTQHVFGQGAFAGNDFVNPLFQGPAAGEFMDRDVSFLANAERAVGRLIFDCRVPPTVKMNDMGSRREVETGAASF